MQSSRTRSTNTARDDMLAKYGRQLTRMFDMFWNPSGVINMGKQLHGMSDDAKLQFRQNACAKKQRELALLDKLNELDPNLMERLTRPGANTGSATRDAKSQASQSNGKSEDMRKVKEAITSWRKWTPPLPEAEEKASRGLNHDECAYLLSDPKVDWTNEEVVTQFKAFNNPPMDPSVWPRLLRPYGEFNPARPSDGLLKGELLIKAARAILFSPSAAKDPATTTTTRVGGARGHSIKRRGTIGIAKSYQLTEVTAPFIAYVAVVVRHSLTSDEVFSDTCSGFNYVEFYDQIREFLESPRFEQISAALIEWWNEQLFSGYQFGQPTLPSDRRNNGTLASLEAQLEGEGPAAQQLL